MKRKRKVFLSLILGTLVSLSSFTFLSSCSSQDNNVNNDNNLLISNDFIQKTIDILTNDLLNVENINDEFEKNIIDKISQNISNNLEILDIEWKLSNSTIDNFKKCYVKLIFNRYITCSYDSNIVNLKNNSLSILIPFDTKIWNSNTNFSISIEDQQSLYDMIVKFCLNYYNNDSDIFNVGVSNQQQLLIDELNNFLSKKEIYPIVKSVETVRIEKYPNNGHKTISLKLIFDTSNKPLKIDESNFFVLNNDELCTKIPIEINVNSIKKDSSGKWDLSYILPLVKEIIISTGLELKSRTNYNEIISNAHKKILELFNPYLVPKNSRIKDDLFYFGSSGKQEIDFQIDFGNFPIIKLSPSYVDYGFEYINNRYLVLKNVKTNIQNLEISNNIFNVSIIIPKILEFINNNINNCSSYDELSNSISVLKNDLNNFFGLTIIKDIIVKENSKKINSKSPIIDLKFDIVFDSKYKIIIDANMENGFEYNANILSTPYISTNIDANYRNISDIVESKFDELTIDDIKNDISNHTIKQFNFLKDNIDYIQTLLQKIVNNDKIYNFIISNANIFGNLINNILTQSVRKNLFINELIENILLDKSLKDILSNNNNINGLINLINEFLPNDAEQIISIINTIKSLPINLIISTLQKLLADKLPNNIIQSLDDLKTMGLLSFIIEHDIDLLGILPTNNILNLILEILKTTTINKFKETGILDFIIELLRTSNGKNLVRDLFLNILNIDLNSSFAKLLNLFIFDNESLNIDTLSGLFYVFANPTTSGGGIIKYKDWFDSIQFSSNFNNANYNNKKLTLNYVAKFKYTKDLYFDIQKLYNLFPNFTISFGSLKINIDFIIKNIPRTISIISNDYVQYTLSINDYVKYHIDDQGNKKCLSWQVAAHEEYDVNMKHSCEKWYRNTPKGAITGVAKVLSKYVSGIFYHKWDVNINFKPDNSVLNNFVLENYNFNSIYNGSVKRKNISSIVKERIKNNILSTVSDNWVSNSQYKYGSGIEWVYLSQYYTTVSFDPKTIINDLLDFSNYNGDYFVKINVLTLAKELEIIGFSLPSIRTIQIKVFFPYEIEDGYGNFTNVIIFNF